MSFLLAFVLDKVVMGSAFLHAAVDNHMAACHLRNHRHLVAHKDYRCGGRQLAKNVVKPLLKRLIHVRQRLIKHQHFGATYDGSTQQRALQLSARELTYAMLSLGFKPHKSDCLLYRFALACATPMQHAVAALG